MADKIALEFDLTADKAQMTLGELEKGFDEMKDRLKEVGRGSEEFKQLTTAMAQTTAEIKNIELGFEGLDREQIASELGSVAGGIGDITASLVLLGGENETIEQIGASIEKAMAISMGFKGAIEGLSSARKLHNNLLKDGTIQQVKETITTSIATAKTWLLDGAKKAYAVTTGVLTGKIKIATVAQRVFNAVIKASPIALLITAIAAAGAAFLAFAKDSSEAAKEQKALKDSLEAVKGEIESVYEEVAEMENAFALAKEGVMSKEKALFIYNETIGQTIGEAETLEEAEKRFHDNTDNYIEAAKKRAQAQELIKMAAEEQTAALLAQEKDNRSTTESTLGGISEIHAAYKDLTSFGVFGYTDAEAEATKKTKEEATKRAVAQSEANAKRFQELAKNLDAEALLIEKNNNFITEADRKKAEADKKAAEEKAEADKAAQKAWEAGAEARAMARSKEQQAKKDALMEDIEIADRNLELDTEELDRNSILIEGLLSNEQILHDAKNFWHNKDLERIAEENAARREAAQDAMNLALTTLNAISDVSNTRADEDLKAEEDRFNTLRATTQLTEKQIAAEEAKSAKIKDDIRKRQFENDKKMQIAMAAINGAQALTSIFAQYPKFDGGFAMVAALASSVITTAATIAKIKATTFQSTPAPALPAIDSGNGGPTGPDAGGGAAITPVSNTSTILGGQKVFVTETDITETQNNVSVIEESATF